MLKNKTKLISLFLVLILLLSATTVFADETNEISISENASNEDDIYSIQSADESIENDDLYDNQNISDENYKQSDVYLAEDQVTIDYVIDGNAFICANSVTINSQIGGDAFIMAKHIIIEENGYINDLFAMAETIEMKGVVYDLYALSNNLNISNGYIYRDLRAFAKTINMNGVVGRNAYISSSNINFNSDDNSNAQIYGDLNYSSNSEISIPDNIISGKINYTKSEEKEASIQSIIADYLFDLCEFLVFVVIIWLLCKWLAPKFLEGTNKYVGTNTLKMLGFGVLALIAVPIICIILILLQLTAGISFTLLGAYILALILSKSLVTITANNYICSKLKIDKDLKKFGMLIVSGIVVWVITNLPYIDGLISFVILVIGLGILVDSIIPKKQPKNINKE